MGRKHQLLFIFPVRSFFQDDEVSDGIHCHFIRIRSSFLLNDFPDIFLETGNAMSGDQFFQ